MVFRHRFEAPIGRKITPTPETGSPLRSGKSEEPRWCDYRSTYGADMFRWQWASSRAPSTQTFEEINCDMGRCTGPDVVFQISRSKTLDERGPNKKHVH
jgi:hypothetical protein